MSSVSPVRKPCCLASAVLLLSLVWGAHARGQTAAEAPPVDKAPTSVQQKLPAWHHSGFSWEHHVSAETLGVGDEPQSQNPTYTMGLSAKLRYYLHEEPGRLLSVRLESGVFREMTNSDSTTARGETSFTDTGLSLVYAHRFQGDADSDGTFFELRPVMLTLPTSKSSYQSGRYFALGALVGVSHIQPVLRDVVKTDVLSNVRLALGYERWFARATVPTNPTFDRVRLTTEGRSLGGDQLSGSSLVRDQLTMSARFRLDFGQRVVWSTDFGIAPGWKYNLQDDVQVCGVVATGCTNVAVSDDDSRYLVSTSVSTEISVSLARSLSMEFGYGNASNQLGQNGRRRSIFYSPSAEFFVALSFTPHELVTPPQQTAQARLAPQTL